MRQEKSGEMGLQRQKQFQKQEEGGRFFVSVTPHEKPLFLKL